MKEHKFKETIILSFIIILLGCPLPNSLDTPGKPRADHCTVRLEITNAGFRTIEPEMDLVPLISSYRIDFTGHESEADFSIDPYTEGSIIESVPAGAWNVVLTGTNAEGNEIATGIPSEENPITISAADNNIDIILSPVDGTGTGTFEWTITFPVDDVDGVTVTADPWPIGDDDEIIFLENGDYTADFPNTGTLSIDTTLPSGMYCVTVLFHKTVEAGQSDHAALCEIVRIYDHLTSSHTTELTGDSFTQPPVMPTDFTAEPDSLTGVYLSWNDTSVLEAGFEIQRAVNAGGFEDYVFPAAGVTGYDETLGTGNDYTYRLRSVNDFGSSEWTETVLVPASPTDFTAVEGIGQIELSWSDSSASNTACVVERSTESGEGYSILETLAEDETEYIDTAADDGTAYYYRLRSEGGTTGSSLTDEASACFGTPDVPVITGITAGTHTTEQSFALSYEAGATIEYSLDGGSSWQEYTGEVAMDTNGTFNITARQTDPAGNVSGNASEISLKMRINGTQYWSYGVGGTIWSSPALNSDGTVYIAIDDGALYALNSDGSYKWHYGDPWFSESSPAVGSDGTIYAGRSFGLQALNPDGSEKWFLSPGGTCNSSPAIDSDGTIYIGGTSGNLYAVHPDGTEKWSLALGDNVYSSPTIGYDDTIYVGSADHSLYAITKDGTVKWSFATGNYIASSPAIGFDGTIYVGSWDTKLYALYPDGTERWSFTTGSWIDSSPSIASDGTIYVGSQDNKLYALNPDGTEQWSFETGNSIVSSPAIGADGTIFVGSYDKKLYAINPDGTEKWSFTTSDLIHSSPVIGPDGTVYVSSINGNVYAVYDDCGGPGNTPWSMFRNNPEHTGLQPYPELDIGDWGPANGRIFYDDEDDGTDDILGVRYLEVGPNYSTGIWYGGTGTDINGDDSGSPPELTGLGTGEANTEAIYNELYIGETYNFAARFCYELTWNHHDDWFLPSKDEMETLRNNLWSYGDNYWTSSEIDDSTAWGVYMNSMRPNPKGMASSMNVAAIRSF